MSPHPTTKPEARPPSAAAGFAEASGGCAGCGVRLAARCALRTPEDDFRLSGSPFDVRARQQICDPAAVEDPPVFVVCAGLACRSRARRGGGRQILAFLMPGQLASVRDIFAGPCGDPIHAITDVACMAFPGSLVRQRLGERPELMRLLVRHLADEVAQAEDALADLGSCAGAGRMARFFVKFARRMYERGWDRRRPIPFPIRQSHLADALGLTTTHVSRILAQLRRDRAVELRDSRITLLDPGRLGRSAGLGFEVPALSPAQAAPSKKKGRTR